MKCCMCDNGAAFGNKCCLECLEKGRIRSKKYYEQHKIENKCKTCHVVIGKKSILCENCKKYEKELRNKRKEDGICVTCGISNYTNGFKCEKCYLNYNKSKKEKKEYRLLNGCCAFCDEKRIHTRLCEKHYLQFTSRTHLNTMRDWEALKDIFEKQKGICPYTGKFLTLGLDASIDHIFPKCLGGSLGLDNLQWVYAPVNFMKADVTEDEFFNLVKLIYENKKLNEKVY